MAAKGRACGRARKLTGLGPSTGKGETACVKPRTIKLMTTSRPSGVKVLPHGAQIRWKPFRNADRTRTTGRREEPPRFDCASRPGQGYNRWRHQARCGNRDTPQAPVVWEELENNPRDGFARRVTITSRRCSLAEELGPGVGELRGCVEGPVDSFGVFRCLGPGIDGGSDNELDYGGC